MRFHVLGIGSIGSLISHHLRRSLPSGHSVTLIHRTLRQARDAQDKGGVIRVDRAGVVETSSDFASEVFEGVEIGPRIQHKTTSEAAQLQRNENQMHENSIESLFVTAKANQTLPALRRLSSRLSPYSTIVLMQNGMGVYEELIQELFRNPLSRPHFILASNTHGVYPKAPFEVVHAGVGEIKFGIMPDPAGRNFEAAFDPSLYPPDRRGKLSDIVQSETDPQFARYKSLRNSVAALVLMDALNTTWVPMEEMQIAMRRKVVVNSVINPLTSVMGCRNGEIFKTEAGIQMMQFVCREAARVFAAEAAEQAGISSHPTRTEEGDEDQTLSFRVSPLLEAKSLEKECLRVAEATKHNISSMLGDVRRGSRETEVNYMNGYLLRLGRKYNIPMPTTLALWRMVYMRSAIPLDTTF
ncbi:2-dehydropantoate 2-reductase (Ketopantoate reductase) (KPA reductase) (KPR) [Marasmius tenuissimus]|uniref:2-dehydropantoate 2-reductase n=1 Tax=Marasmius tenuissimus TaxID=585030 RepID=A0ABR3A517_9AGAR